MAFACRPPCCLQAELEALKGQHGSSEDALRKAAADLAAREAELAALKVGDDDLSGEVCI